MIGAEKHDAGAEYPSYRGLVDELRLSTVLRYTGDFPLQTHRFAPDAQTAGLYHFDEGSGPVVRDAATVPGAPSDGIVRTGRPQNAPVWVASDAPTGP